MFHYRIPQEPLASFVSLLWIQEGSNPSVRRERLLPDGAMELVIDLRCDTVPLFDAQTLEQSGRARGGVFCGAHSQSFLIERARDESVVGVHFQPGGAFPFFSLPIRELTNSVVSIEDLWAGAVSELRERLAGAPSAPQKLDILEAFLLAQATRPLRRHPVVDFALQQWKQNPTLPVAQVAQQAGVSARRFIQLFHDETGLTPKLFCRVRRFQGAASPQFKTHTTYPGWSWHRPGALQSGPFHPRVSVFLQPDSASISR